MSNTTLTTLRMRLKTSVLALALLALPLAVSAAGLGKVTVLSALGQPLRAELEITASREELSSLSARVASPNAFKQAGIEYSPALVDIRITVDKRPDGQPFLSMVSDRSFNEPFLDLLVELDWTSGRLVREYTFLLDPPESLQKPAASMAAPVAVPEVKREEPATITMQAPAAVAKQPEVPVAGPSALPSDEQQKTPRPEMKVVRGADGIQRIVKVEPAQEKLPKEVATRLVKQGDTLSKIASETKPAGVNLDQMLVALFLNNKDAFENNVNRLKAGKIIAIPDRETAAAVNADEAKTTIRAHAADFDAYRRKLAATVASAASQKEEAPKRAVSGKIQPKVEERASAPVPGKDKLEVSKSEAPLGAAGKAGSGRITAIEETLVAREKALKEANSRIAELEKNLNDLKKLVELKSQGMADLQKQAQPGQLVAPVAQVGKPTTAPESVKPVAKTPEATVQPVQPPAPKPEPAPTVKKPLPPPSPPQPSSPPPPSPPELSYIDQSPEIVYGGGAILALLLGYFGYSRWRKQRQADDQASIETASTGDHSDRSTFGLGGGQRVDTDDLLAQTDFSSQSSMGASGSNVGVDPVAEADVYMAYGRDTQAEEILLDALKSDPTRHAIHLKLLEIYAARNSTKQFEAIATDLNQQTGGVGSDWEKAAALGQRVDPANPLYGDRTEEAMKFDPNAPMLLAPARQGAGTSLESLDSLESLKDEEAAEVAEAEETQPPIEMPSVHADFTESLDFELDLAADAQKLMPSTAESEPGIAQAQSEDEMSGSLDIELDLEPGTPAVTQSGAVPPSPQDEPSGSRDIDFDFDAGTLQPIPADTAVAADSMKQPDAPVEMADVLDFDFDLGSGKPPDTPVLSQPDESNVIDFDLDLPVPAAKQPAAESLDLPSINLDIDEPIVPTAPPSLAAHPAASNLDLSSISLELDASPQSSPAAEPDEAAMQEVATKLELALAYEEMGDKEGARELLQEVINEGTAVQQEAARSKLAQLDR